jgi:hypothetical protein
VSFVPDTRPYALDAEVISQEQDEIEAKAERHPYDDNRPIGAFRRALRHLRATLGRCG